MTFESIQGSSSDLRARHRPRSHDPLSGRQALQHSRTPPVDGERVDGLARPERGSWGFWGGWLAVIGIRPGPGPSVAAGWSSGSVDLCVHLGTGPLIRWSCRRPRKSGFASQSAGSVFLRWRAPSTSSPSISLAPVTSSSRSRHRSGSRPHRGRAPGRARHRRAARRGRDVGGCGVRDRNADRLLLEHQSRHSRPALARHPGRAATPVAGTSRCSTTRTSGRIILRRWRRSGPFSPCRRPGWLE